MLIGYTRFINDESDSRCKPMLWKRQGMDEYFRKTIERLTAGTLRLGPLHERRDFSSVVGQINYCLDIRLAAKMPATISKALNKWIIPILSFKKR